MENYPNSNNHIKKSDLDSIGLYFHIPFCTEKCPYCDFFSLRGTDTMMDEYTNCIISRINSESEHSGRKADSLYFGGGTPSLLGGARIARMTEAARRSFGLENAEITAEANPGRELGEFFRVFAAAGGNRISIGMQSAEEKELRGLGRKHTAKDAERAVKEARAAGIGSVSLDLMLATPGQTQESLARSIAFCAELGAEHVSAYLLKVEPGTAFWKERETLELPDEDAAADLYLAAAEGLAARGYRQYEISNFARPGFEGRHNLKYWRCEEYLGLGPAAHSFLDGKRFHYERSLRGFLSGEGPVQDGEGGDFEEFAMLRLRLAEGLTDAACLARFGHPIPDSIRLAAEPFFAPGLMQRIPGGFRFTPRGFLVSDALTVRLLKEAARELPMPL